MKLQDQPAYIIKMRAKPGMGDKLFELATVGMAKSGASDRFIIAREDGDPRHAMEHRGIQVRRGESAL